MQREGSGDLPELKKQAFASELHCHWVLVDQCHISHTEMFKQFSVSPQ